MLNPGNTLNKYAYDANNPLRYTDPDGKDITVFFENPGFTTAGDFSSGGHIMFVAENQQNGQAAAMSFGPTERNAITALSGTVGSTTTFGLANMSVSDLKQNYASLTIQTSPEEAQKVIAFIRSLPVDITPYTLFSQNRATVCRETLKIIQKLAGNNKDWTPTGLWKGVFAQYANSWWRNGFGYWASQPGEDYGYHPNNYDPYMLVWILALAQAAAGDNGSVYETWTVNLNTINCGGASAQCSQ